MAEIALTRGYVAVVDDADLALVSAYRWYPRHGKRTVYATTNVNGKSIEMHRMIMSTPSGLETDHWDGDGLNNRRDNLRNATRAENDRNQRNRVPKHGYRGIQPDGRSWRAMMTVRSKTVYLGCYATPEEAAEAYNRRALTEFGAFAVLNPVPPGIEPSRLVRQGRVSRSPTAVAS